MKSPTIFFSLLLVSCMACGESLPTGYVQSGGLLWAPIKTKDIWTNIAGSGVCTRENPVGVLGYTSGWRQPTRRNCSHFTLHTPTTPQNCVPRAGFCPTPGRLRLVLPVIMRMSPSTMVVFIAHSFARPSTTYRVFIISGRGNRATDCLCHGRARTRGWSAHP